MRVSSVDGYDGVFGVAVVVAGTVAAGDLPSFRSMVVLVCLFVIAWVYAKRIRNAKALND